MNSCIYADNGFSSVIYFTRQEDIRIQNKVIITQTKKNKKSKTMQTKNLTWSRKLLGCRGHASQATRLCLR